ncbi:dehydrogenase [Rhizobium laguerreae]|uniref:dehydrogenase n=1 Tax=Rhizobium laguerreae TaxID=1076926 RepID=UPI0014411523|nr:dehydrogenase [Rhizobium laguerreae]NKN12296.1 dehydrogenase [Rhizobium laguerreae]
MLAERHTTPESNPVYAAMAWHGGDPRATIDALLKDRERLCEQLAIARACISKGYTRGWLPGAEFEG